jgi:hypothetical protein
MMMCGGALLEKHNTFTCNLLCFGLSTTLVKFVSLLCEKGGDCS